MDLVEKDKECRENRLLVSILELHDSESVLTFGLGYIRNQNREDS